MATRTTFFFLAATAAPLIGVAGLKFAFPFTGVTDLAGLPF